MSHTLEAEDSKAKEDTIEKVNAMSLEKGDNSAQRTIPAVEDEAQLGGPRFSPPLYRQRYRFCADMLAKHGIKSVADFGCAECQVMIYLKQVSCLERIGLVDKDAVILELNQHRAQPLIADHLAPRDNPLTVEMYQGSVTDPDPRLANVEAVTMLELIEHLPEAELTAFPMTIFGSLHPRLVIITTPNADFNQLFPDLTGFRHWDHKFEWTRQEFQNWCTQQAVKYDYEVEFTGVGLGPPGTEPLGYCSQAAIFVSNSPSASSSSSSSCGEEDLKYTLLLSSQHPHKTERFTLEEKMTMEVDYCLNHLSKDPSLSDGCDNAVIPIDYLHRYAKVKEFFNTQDDLLEFLRNHDYTLTADSASVVFCLEKESDEGAEWGEHPEELFDGCGQFSDVEDDMSIWSPGGTEELWD